MLVLYTSSVSLLYGAGSIGNLLKGAPLFHLLAILVPLHPLKVIR
jgi:hypothetical protein